jgi:hypothetical protein
MSDSTPNPPKKAKKKHRIVRIKSRFWAEREERRKRYDEQEARELAVKEKNAESIAAFAKAFGVYADAIAAQGKAAVQ